MTREDILQAALSYLDIPFRMNGRSRRGLDCIGIPLVLARDLQVNGWREFWSDSECHEYPTIRPPGYMRAKLDGFVDRDLLRRIDVDKLCRLIAWIGH